MPDYLQITGGQSLTGTIKVSGAKNSSLPLMMATLLTSEECILENIPDLEDTTVTTRLLTSLGAEVEYVDSTIRIRTPQITSSIAPYGAVKAMRASFWVLGPLLARSGEAQVALPGGDAIGTRPVDLHLGALTQMGADIRLRHGVVIARAADGLRPCAIDLAYPSVGATHQILMTASLVPGVTVLNGAAREPEVVDLANLLNGMGAEIEGAGTPKIVIRGQSELRGVKHRIIGDRIEAATYLLSAMMTQGSVTVSGLMNDRHVDDRFLLGELPQLLSDAGCGLSVNGNDLTLTARSRAKAVSFSSLPYPGIATDMQPLLMAAMCVADGVSNVTETVFENRYGHVAEYRRLGAQIAVDGRSARIEGRAQLSSAPVEASDIRAAAGLVLLGLVAQGVTDLHEIYHLDRGYERLIEKFSKLGARVRRVPQFEQRDLILGC